MEFGKKHLFSLIVILIIALSAISIASAYTGTGFSHNIPGSKYYDMSASDILSKYGNTDCHVEERKEVLKDTLPLKTLFKNYALIKKWA